MNSCFMALVSSEICVILIYGLSICGTRDSQSSLPQNRLPGSKVKNIYIHGSVVGQGAQC